MGVCLVVFLLVFVFFFFGRPVQRRSSQKEYTDWMSTTKEQMRGEKGSKIIFLIIVWYSPQVKLLS